MSGIDTMRKHVANLRDILDRFAQDENPNPDTVTRITARLAEAERELAQLRAEAGGYAVPKQSRPTPAR